MFFCVFFNVFFRCFFFLVFVAACAHVPWHSNSSRCRSCLPTAPPGGCGSGLQEATTHCPRLAWQRGGVPEELTTHCPPWQGRGVPKGPSARRPPGGLAVTDRGDTARGPPAAVRRCQGQADGLRPTAQQNVVLLWVWVRHHQGWRVGEVGFWGSRHCPPAYDPPIQRGAPCAERAVGPSTAGGGGGGQ